MGLDTKYNKHVVAPWTTRVFWETAVWVVVRIWLWLMVNFSFFRLNTSPEAEDSWWVSFSMFTGDSWDLDGEWWTAAQDSTVSDLCFLDGTPLFFMVLRGAFFEVTVCLTLLNLGLATWSAIGGTCVAVGGTYVFVGGTWVAVRVALTRLGLGGEEWYGSIPLVAMMWLDTLRVLSLRDSKIYLGNLLSGPKVVWYFKGV